MKLIAYIPRMFKAVAGAAVAGSGAYASAVDGGVTGPEWIVIVGAVLAAGLAVWMAPNASAPGT